MSFVLERLAEEGFVIIFVRSRPTAIRRVCSSTMSAETYALLHANVEETMHERATITDVQGKPSGL